MYTITRASEGRLPSLNALSRCYSAGLAATTESKVCFIGQMQHFLATCLWPSFDPALLQHYLFIEAQRGLSASRLNQLRAFLP